MLYNPFPNPDPVNQKNWGSHGNVLVIKSRNSEEQTASKASGNMRFKAKVFWRVVS